MLRYSYLILLSCLLALFARAEPPAGVAPEADGAPSANGSGSARTLNAGGVEFGVAYRPAERGPARGALVLIPGGAPTSRALAVLQHEMPRFGWSVWLAEIEDPPRVHAGTLTDAPEAKRAEELLQWAERGRARVAALAAAAANEGPVVLAAAGVGAALLTGLATDTTQAAQAMVLLDPVELPGLPARWPAVTATPVLEVIDPSERMGQASARQAQAASDRLVGYRQMLLVTEIDAAGGGEEPLVRRLRGWLSSL